MIERLTLDVRRLTLVNLFLRLTPNVKHLTFKRLPVPLFMTVLP